MARYDGSVDDRRDAKARLSMLDLLGEHKKTDLPHWDSGGPNEPESSASRGERARIAGPPVWRVFGERPLALEVSCRRASGVLSLRRACP